MSRAAAAPHQYRALSQAVLEIWKIHTSPSALSAEKKHKWCTKVKALIMSACSPFVRPLYGPLSQKKKKVNDIESRIKRDDRPLQKVSKKKHATVYNFRCLPLARTLAIPGYLNAKCPLGCQSTAGCRAGSSANSGTRYPAGRRSRQNSRTHPRRPEKRGRWRLRARQGCGSAPRALNSRRPTRSSWGRRRWVGTDRTSGAWRWP